MKEASKQSLSQGEDEVEERKQESPSAEEVPSQRTISPLELKDTIEGESSSVDHSGKNLLHKLQDLSVKNRGSGSRDTTPKQTRGVSTSPAQQISPSELDSLRGTSTPHSDSPNASQVSIGSIGPSLVASLVPGPRHYDLTPIANNTTNEAAKYVDQDVDDEFVVVSPNDGGILHGEHLALPADLSAESLGPSMPPLRTMERARSVGTIENQCLLQAAYAARAEQVNEEAEDLGEQQLPDPVQFPERGFYSFTSRKQYEQQHKQHEEEQVPLYSESRKPYQPSREVMEDVGALSEEELSRIFIPRRRGTGGSNSGDSREHRLQNPIPMDERQWSIPSIRMAHHVNGSTTSCTENTDDEESISYIRGGDDDGSLDASISSRASSLYLAEDAQGEPLGGVAVMPPRVAFAPEVFGEPAKSFPMEATDDHDADASADAVDGNRPHRKRKQRKKERQAYEWLHSVEADQNCVAEAASSKFLTAGLRKEQHQQQELDRVQENSREAIIRRQSSPPSWNEDETAHT